MFVYRISEITLLDISNKLRLINQIMSNPQGSSGINIHPNSFLNKQMARYIVESLEESKQTKKVVFKIVSIGVRVLQVCISSICQRLDSTKQT